MKLNITQKLRLGIFILVICFAACKRKTVIEQRTDQTEPVLAFNYSGNQVAPAELEFQNLSMYADQYQWYFGNGASSAKQQPGKVVFTDPGEYEVLLTGQNSYKRNAISKTITILAKNEPTALFSYQFKNNQTIAPATVILSNESINADSFEWEIKGELVKSSRPADVLFSQPGDYPIKLTAIKNGIRSALFQKTISITANLNPIARFTRGYEPFPYHVGQLFLFVNKSVNSDSWLWTFESGKPASSTEQHPVVEFTTAGDHKITLVAKKGGLSSAPAVSTIRIAP